MHYKDVLEEFNVDLFQKDLIEWFRREQRNLPWREDKNPYKIWVSEIMLQQTKVEAVIPYFQRFMEKFPTLEALAKADEQDVLKAWEGLGYYSRARNLHAAVKEVVAKYGGEVPRDKEQIAKLKGVGPYTTGAILSIAFGIPEPAVDGNVMRVFARIFSIWEDIAKVKTRTLFENIVRNVIDEANPSDFNQALMELGAIVCTPKSPSCLLCPVQQHCRAFAEGAQHELPIKGKKKAAKEVDLLAVVIENENGEVLVQKRPDSGLLANLWEFPNVEYVAQYVPKQIQISRFVQETYNLELEQLQYLTQMQHVFSHLVWNISLYKAKTTSSWKNSEHQLFVSPENLAAYPLSVSNQKIIQQYLLS